jgi:cytochrome c-type protein NapB
VAGLGFAPPSPHETTTGLSATSRCRQCHVEQTTTDSFVANDFEGLRQDLRPGRRSSAQAPPVMPHPRFMRENCSACHSGLAAREQIRTPHPERVRCAQCHVEQTTGSSFEPA